MKSLFRPASINRVLMVSLLFGAISQAAGRSMHFVTEPFPPFTLEQDNRAVGPMVDVLNEACRRLQWQCSIEVMPWRRALTLAEQGKVDGIFTVVDIPERRALFHVSVPVVKAHYALFALKPATALRRLPGELAGREIGVYGPSATSVALQKLVGERGTVDIRLEPDNLTVLKKLAAGRYGRNGLAMVNRDVANWLITNNAITNVGFAGPVSELAYSFGLSRRRIDAGVAYEFNQVLSALCEAGQLRRIAGSYRLRAADCVAQP